MQPSVKHYADYLSMGLEIGACFQSDVVAWADRLIEQSDRPEMWMIELSTSANKSVLDVYHLLHAVPGASNLDASLKLLLAQLGKRYSIIQSEHIQLLRRLTQLIETECLYDHPSQIQPLQLIEAEISDKLKACIDQLECDLDWLEYSKDYWSEIERDYNDLLSIGEEYRHLMID